MLPAVNFIEHCMLFLLLIFRAGAAQMATCKTDTVEEGNIGSMEFSFSPEIDFTKTVLLHLQKVKTDKETGPDLLICDGLDERSNPFVPCTSNNSHFKTKGLIGQTLTVLIPNATRQLHGEYVLSALLDEDDPIAARCNFTVVKKEGLASDDTAGMKSDEVKTIVAPVVAVVLLIVIVAAVIGFLLVRRRRRNEEEASITETESMNKPEDGTKTAGENTTV